MRTPNLLSTLLVLSLGLSGSAEAHGFHYDLDVTSQLQEDSGGKLTGLRMNWFYDTDVTKTLLEGEDMSVSKQAETLQAIAQRAIADLDKLHYYTGLTLAGKALVPAQATDYHMDLLPDGHLNLNFLLPLTTPQDMAGKQLDIALSDSTGSAILMYQDASRIGMGEKLSTACKLVLEEKQQYADGEAPQLVHIQCH